MVVAISTGVGSPACFSGAVALVHRALARRTLLQRVSLGLPLRGRFAPPSMAIDQLLRGDRGSLIREPPAVFLSVATNVSVQENAAPANYLGRLEPLKSKLFDTTARRGN